MTSNASIDNLAELMSDASIAPGRRQELTRSVFASVFGGDPTKEVRIVLRRTLNRKLPILTMADTAVLHY